MVPKLDTFPASPYKSMESLYLKTSDKKTTQHAETPDVIDHIATIIHEEIRTMETISPVNDSTAEVGDNHVPCQQCDGGSFINHNDSDVPDSNSHTPQQLNSLTTMELKSALNAHLLNILNNGSYEDLVALEGIGKVRAMKIFTKRNAGFMFESVDDLEHIGLNQKNISKFVKQNFGSMLC
jgi:DNA uptake protein ComE-like DNA-binding protein